MKVYSIHCWWPIQTLLLNISSLGNYSRSHSSEHTTHTATKAGEGEGEKKKKRNTRNLRTKQFQARQDTSITDLSLNWSPSLKQAFRSVRFYTHTQAQYTVITGNKVKIWNSSCNINLSQHLFGGEDKDRKNNSIKGEKKPAHSSVNEQQQQQQRKMSK